MTDIVERLRWAAWPPKEKFEFIALLETAAMEIERLREGKVMDIVDRLRKSEDAMSCLGFLATASLIRESADEIERLREQCGLAPASLSGKAEGIAKIVERPR